MELGFQISVDDSGTAQQTLFSRFHAYYCLVWVFCQPCYLRLYQGCAQHSADAHPTPLLHSNQLRRTPLSRGEEGDPAAAAPAPARPTDPVASTQLSYQHSSRCRACASGATGSCGCAAATRPATRSRQTYPPPHYCGNKYYIFRTYLPKIFFFYLITSYLISVLRFSVVLSALSSLSKL